MVFVYQFPPNKSSGVAANDHLAGWSMYGKGLLKINKTDELLKFSFDNSSFVFIFVAL